MTGLQRYLAEEIAVDHADGLITRREALRRLGLLGVSVAAASSLLADTAGASPSAAAAAPRSPASTRRRRSARARSLSAALRDGG
jgi:carboxymethylenebutenolidase